MNPGRNGVKVVMLGGILLTMLALSACASGEVQTVVVTQVVEGEVVTQIVEAGPEVAENSQGSDSLIGFDPQEQWTNAQSEQRMIIKNSDMELLVEDTGHSIDLITQIAAENGGYVLSSQSWQDINRDSAEITIAVRSDQFEVAMRRLRESAVEVIRESASGEDVSGEYVDLDSRLRNLEATRDRIKTFLDETKTVKEALEVNRELAEIEAEIEQVKGRMQYLAGRSAFSTISIQLHTEQPQAEPPAPWTLGKHIEQSLATQGEVAQAVAAGLLWLIIVPGPYLIALACLAFAFRALRRRIQARQP